MTTEMLLCFVVGLLLFLVFVLAEMFIKQRDKLNERLAFDEQVLLHIENAVFKRRSLYGTSGYGPLKLGDSVGGWMVPRWEQHRDEHGKYQKGGITGQCGYPGKE